MTLGEPPRPQVLAPRPSKALIVGLVVSGLCVLATMAVLLLSGSPVGFGLSVTLGVAPLPVLLAAVLALDRLEPEPKLSLIFAFSWGAGIAVVLAVVLTLAGQAVVMGLGVGESVANDIGTVVLAPVIEEGLKGAALLLLLRRRSEIDGLTDGIIYACMAGLGFAAVENVGYYLTAFAANGAEGAAGLFVFRGLIAPLGHPVYTSMIGLGVAYAATRRGPARLLAIPLGYLGAVLLHGLWNGMAVAGSLLGLALVYFVLMAVIGALVAVTVSERRQLVARIGHYLPGYLPTGLVTPREIGMLGSLRTRREARAWARSVGAGQAMSDYQQAATELTMLHTRAEREAMDPARFAAEREALLNLMAGSRAGLTARAGA